VTREQLQDFKEPAQLAGAGATRLQSEQNGGVEKRTVVPASAKLGQRRSALRTKHSGPVRAAERRGRPDHFLDDGSRGLCWRPNYVGRSVRELNITGEDENDT
jgi:hypothetical protein